MIGRNDTVFEIFCTFHLLLLYGNGTVTLRPIIVNVDENL